MEKKTMWGRCMGGLLFLLVGAMLTACGDDTDVVIPVVNMEDVGNTADSLENEGQEETSKWTILGEEDLVAPETENGANDSSVETVEAPAPSTVSITISATGDVTLGNHHKQDYGYSFRQAYDQAEDAGYFFENVYDIFSKDDMTIVNLEGVLSFSEDILEGEAYNIKGDPEYVSILTKGSVEAVGFANNHRLDYGEQGSTDTVNALQEEGIVYAYEENVGIYETQGIKIGYVSVNKLDHGEAAAEKKIREGIAKLQEQEVDLILVCCHWGIERDNYPDNDQQTLGKKCIDWGADLVLGHHPHVLQGIEEYQGKFIVYSLANFCFGANRNPSDKDTMIFQQTFTFVDGEKQEDKDIRVIPCSVSSVSTRNDFKPTPAEGDEAKRIMDRINEYSEGFGVSFSEEGLLEQ